VKKLKVDFACGTARKWLRGPRGTGFLFVRKAMLSSKVVGEPPLLDHSGADWYVKDKPAHYVMQQTAIRYELWESNKAGNASMAVAIDEAMKVGLFNIQKKAFTLAADLRKGLAAIPGVTVRCVKRKLPAKTGGIVIFDADQAVLRPLRSRLS